MLGERADAPGNSALGHRRRDVQDFAAADHVPLRPAQFSGGSSLQRVPSRGHESPVRLHATFYRLDHPTAVRSSRFRSRSAFSAFG